MNQTLLISSSTGNNIRSYDLKTLTLQYSFKQNNHTTQNTKELNYQKLNLVQLNLNSEANSSDTIITSLQSDRPLLHIYGYGKETAYLRFALPEKMSSVEISNSDSIMFCVTGSISGKIYLWELPSGQLLRVFDAHYKNVNLLKFSNDNSVLVSAAEDATVHVWKLTEIFHPKLSNTPKPMHAWSDHTLSITSIYLGQNINNNRIVTSSKDNSVKLYDLFSGELLITYLLPCSVNSVTMNSKEINLIAGGDDGVIYLLPLYQKQTFEDSYHLKNNAGEQNVISVNQNTYVNLKHCFKGHEHPILTLKFDITGTKVIGGDNEGNVVVFDFNSKQVIHKLNLQEGAVTSIQIFSTPKEISNLNFKNSSNSTLNLLQPFQRTLQKEINNLKWFTPSQSNDFGEIDKAGFLDSELFYDKREIDYMPNIEQQDDNNEKKHLERINSLEKDIQGMYNFYQQQKNINATLYDTILKLKAEQQVDEGDEEI